MGICVLHMELNGNFFLENLENNFLKSCENKKNRVGDGVEGEQKLKK